jgi:hypothetical protein
MKWLVDMPDMNDGSIMAQLERRLAKEDPELASTMRALNLKFPANPQSTPCDAFEADKEECAWWVTAASVLVIIAFLGLFIVVALTSEVQGSYRDPGPLHGSGAVAQGAR